MSLKDELAWIHSYTYTVHLQFLFLFQGGLEGELSNIRCGFWDEELDQGG